MSSSKCRLSPGFGIAEFETETECRIVTRRDAHPLSQQQAHASEILTTYTEYANWNQTLERRSSRHEDNHLSPSYGSSLPGENATPTISAHQCVRSVLEVIGGIGNECQTLTGKAL